MRAITPFIAAAILIGVAGIAAPDVAEARFGAGAIADAVAEATLVQPVQNRTQRAPRRAAPARTTPRTQADTVSPYRYPGSRGALDSCSFC
jgi:hypothetical protein